jgi:hypothetical protein
MKKIMHILFLSCLKATELIEKKLHFKLSTTEKLQLKVHKMMCDACTNYEEQNIIIEKAIENQEKKEEQFAENKINLAAFKKSILDKLEK